MSFPVNQPSIKSNDDPLNILFSKPDEVTILGAPFDIIPNGTFNENYSRQRILWMSDKNFSDFLVMGEPDIIFTQGIPQHVRVLPCPNIIIKDLEWAGLNDLLVNFLGLDYVVSTGAIPTSLPAFSQKVLSTKYLINSVPLPGVTHYLALPRPSSPSISTLASRGTTIELVFEKDFEVTGTTDIEIRQLDIDWGPLLPIPASFTSDRLSPNSSIIWNSQPPYLNAPAAGGFNGCVVPLAPTVGINLEFRAANHIKAGSYIKCILGYNNYQATDVLTWHIEINLIVEGSVPGYIVGSFLP